MSERNKLFVNINSNNQTESATSKIIIDSKLDLCKIPINTILHENLLNFKGAYFKKLYEEAEKEEKKELQNDSQIEEEETSPSPKNINNINMNTNNQIIEQKKEEEEPKEKVKKNDSKKSNKISKSKKEIKINSKSDNAIKETKPKMTNLLNIPINKPVRVDKIFKLNVIYFEMKYDTQMGENIAVIGSIDRLGNWDTSRVLNLKWNEGNVWGASLDYNEINDFEYKFIFVKDGYVKEWEDGINRKFIFQQIKSLIEPNLINGNIIRLKNIMSQSLEYDFNNYSLKIISEWNKK